MPNKLHYLLLTVFCWFMMSCGEIKEGCTNPNAQNFDVAAEKDCCCLFPQLGVSFPFVVDDKPFKEYTNEDSPGDTLWDADNNGFHIKSLAFYVSDFEFKMQDGSARKSENRFWLFPNPNSGKDSTYSIDDYGLIKTGQNNDMDYFFRFEKIETIQSISFTIGVVDSAYQSRIVSIREIGHPLSEMLDTMYNYDQHRYFTLKTRISSIDQSFIEHLIILDQPNLRYRFSEIPINYNLKLGFNQRIIFPINLNILFKNINFKTDNEQFIIDRINLNISELF